MFKSTLMDQLNHLANPLGNTIANQVLTRGIGAALAIQKSQLMEQLGHHFMPKNSLNKDFVKSALGIPASFYDARKNLDTIYRQLGLSQFDLMMNGIGKSLRLQNSIMEGILPKIHEIKANHIDFITGVSRLQDFTKQYNSIALPKSFSSLYGLEEVLFGLSYRITKDALSSQRLDTLDDFLEVSNHAGVIKERIIEQQAVTKDDLVELRNLFLETTNKLGRKIDGRDKNLIGRTLQYIMIFAFILDLISNIVNVYHIIYDRVNPQQNAAPLTKNDLDAFKSELIDSLTNLAPPVKTESRYTRVQVNLRAKPRTRSLVIEVLPMGQEVILLDSCGKWVQVSTRDNGDDVVVYGWLLKKHLFKNR